MSNEVAKTTAKENEETALSTEVDLAEDAGAGFELADAKSYSIPFLLILQGQSPQLETIDGARPGRFFNTATKELYERCLVIPCHFKREFIRWAPRKLGGGYKGRFDAAAVDNRTLEGLMEYQGALYMDVPEGQIPVDDEGKAKFDALTDTRSHYLLVKSGDGTWQPVMFNLKSTQIRKSKNWLTQMRQIKVKNPKGELVTPSMYSHMFELSTVKEENPEGSWWGVDVKLVGPQKDPSLRKMSKEFYDEICQGLVETAQPIEE